MDGCCVINPLGRFARRCPEIILRPWVRTKYCLREAKFPRLDYRSGAFLSVGQENQSRWIEPLDHSELATEVSITGIGALNAQDLAADSFVMSSEVLLDAGAPCAVGEN